MTSSACSQTASDKAAALSAENEKLRRALKRLLAVSIADGRMTATDLLGFNEDAEWIQDICDAARQIIGIFPPPPNRDNTHFFGGLIETNKSKARTEQWRRDLAEWSRRMDAATPPPSSSSSPKGQAS